MRRRLQLQTHPLLKVFWEVEIVLIILKVSLKLYKSIDLKLDGSKIYLDLLKS